MTFWMVMVGLLVKVPKSNEGQSVAPPLSSPSVIGPAVTCLDKQLG